MQIEMAFVIFSVALFCNSSFRAEDKRKSGEVGEETGNGVEGAEGGNETPATASTSTSPTKKDRFGFWVYDFDLLA